jgi:hypothetical protein
MDGVAAPASGSAGIELGRRFVDSIMAQDWEGLARCFAPEARFLAVVGNEQRPFREKLGGQEASEQISRWFGDADVMELQASEVEPLADRVRIVYRIREHEPDGWYLVEQTVYATPGAQGFTRVNLACSDFRPVAG